MARTWFSRRKFLRQGIATTTAAIGWGVLPGQARSSSGLGKARFVGTIESVTRDRGRVFVEGLGTIDLVLVPGAKVVHAIGADPSPDLSAFRVGGRIGFSGDLSDGVVRATSVETAFMRLTTVVLEDTGEVIRTTNGAIRVSADTRERLPQLERGSTFVAVVSSHSGEAPLLEAWDLR